ncbi:TIR domain-containing protein [Saccharothrix sp. 6-C]|uniref:TIR domain-containing protein n=1 Tax=Saccharothrix sp. 6-C TaxID=2781735 RepID=UPI0019174978|nr:TIR domain-containing protein [Saccharothrix sp. 6-C]QQQ78175.1 TIR domain-containing protein [Saccharothrix sp. 6-C]
MDRRGIFLNYRQNRYASPERDDLEKVPHAQLVEAIADRLRRHFGAHVVFLDTELRTGAHYPSELRRKLRESEVLVAVLHPGWTDDLTDRRMRLRPDEYDWVHQEIGIALREGIHVFPLLIGEAELPPRNRLPEDIRDMSFAQARWIRFGSWEQDLRLLIQALEHHVRAAAVPEMKVPAEPALRPRWEFAAAFLLGVLLPVGMTWLLQDDPWERAVFLTALTIVVLLMMVLWAGGLFLLYRIRRWLDTVDEAAAKIAHDQKSAVIIGSTVAGFAVAFLFTDNTFDSQTRILLLAAIVAIAITSGAKWILRFRTPQDWPKSELPASTTNVRAELDLVAKHISGHEPLLTRLQRDQAMFSLRQIEETTAVLERLAARGRWEWLRSAVPWGWANALLIGAVWGAAVGSVVNYLVGGGTAWWAPPLGLLACVTAAASLWGCTEFAFLRQRWQRSVVVRAVPARLAELTERLATSSIAPSGERQSDVRTAADGGVRHGDGHLDGAQALGFSDEDADHHGPAHGRSGGARPGRDATGTGGGALGGHGSPGRS